MINFVPNEKFTNVLSLLKNGKINKLLRSSDFDEYKEFIKHFPASKLTSLTLDQYCIGKKDNANFCWWIERGLVKPLGRFSPGSSRGHIIYYNKNGDIYKNDKLKDLTDNEALIYTLKIQSVIANADTNSDLSWIDNDNEIYEHAKVKNLVTIGHARKLRLLSCYKPELFIPISSSEHLGHFLKVFGCPDDSIPSSDKPIARMLLLLELYKLACKEIELKNLSTLAFMHALYSEELNIAPIKDKDPITGVAPKIWKISHGNDQTGVNQDEHDLLLKKGYVAIGFFYKPEHRQRQRFEAIKPNDYFYLVRNAQIILLGQLEDLPPLEIEGITNRFCRKFKPLTSLNIIPEEANLTKRVIGYKMDEPFNSSDIDCSDVLRGLGFMPSGQTTVFEVGEAYLKDFESSILKPVFNLSLENLFITSASEQILDNAENLKGKEMQQAFNQILYGPPGTGKTYNTVNKAIKIANPSTEENTTREQIKTEFDELIKSGQVVFTTFHQSMSYEDFIEGIKPLKPENGDTFVKYKIQDGIFKQICDNAKSNSNKNFVLIIDEINRGNVSQIFGELITLIEDDKRVGCPEALEVTLPYSKVKFGVPSNLYIIGTMNTADRSVEALDAALRRRFSFEEMQPDSNLIKNKGKLKDGLLKLADDEINLPNLLKVINLRIEKLLDKDHQIGHSYFINVEKLDELKLAFQNKIIPLLQEYFFGDYGKIGLVLGKGFVEKVQNKSSFADFPDADADEFSQRPIFKIKTPASDDAFIEAINSLLNKKTNGE